jgi:hypothetical protein
MRYKDLDYTTQILLVTILTILLAVVVVRAAIFLYRNFVGVPQRYPRTWTPAQCRLMNGFRLFIGVALSALWIALLIATPQMPTSWPFGFLEVVSLAALLLLTNGWILLVLPRDWERFGQQTKRFSLATGALMLWWALMLSGTAWILAKASAPPVLPVIKMPVVAAVADPEPVGGAKAAPDASSSYSTRSSTEGRLVSSPSSK